MQVNPNIQYNEEDAGLTLDNPITEPVEKVESSNAQDEADLITAEKEQKEVTVDRSQGISLLRQFVQSRKDDRLFAASCMAAGVISVVVVYFLAVFM
jgi:hypothetical protein